jgi:hypothetical protein
MLARRSFLRGVFSVLAAPAVVQFQNIMPVKAMPAASVLDAWMHDDEWMHQEISLGYRIVKLSIDGALYREMHVPLVCLLPNHGVKDTNRTQSQ